MSIFEAMTSPADTLARTAYFYWHEGLSIIPLDGKKPAIPTWTPFMDNRPAWEVVKFWMRRWHSQNVGIVCGAVSGGLVVIDLDGLDAVHAFYNRFPQLTETLTVGTGSGEGRHLYYWCENTETVRMKGVEVRGDGCYVVAPPSIHPVTGKAYFPFWGRPDNLMRVELDAVRDWIRAQRPAPKLPQAGREITQTSAWAQAALQGELDTLARASEGNFNNALYRAALKLGSIVAARHLDRAHVENVLYATAQQCGYVTRDGSAQTVRTINSGLRTGMKNPRGRA